MRRLACTAADRLRLVAVAYRCVLDLGSRTYAARALPISPGCVCALSGFNQASVASLRHLPLHTQLPGHMTLAPIRVPSAVHGALQQNRTHPMKPSAYT